LLLRIGVAESRIFKILPGVDMSSFAPAPKDAALIAKFGLDGKVVVMSVSRLVERKGHSHVLKALRQVRDSVPEFHYLIVGDGPERKNIEQLVADLGLGRQVTVVGGVSGEDLGKFYNLCDLFVLANRDVEGDVEGFGMVFLEANACGKPVLGGRTGGTSEAVIEGSTGLLVDPEDIDQIASALRLLISDAALRERLGAAGLARVRADFSWDTRTEQLSAVSEFVLGHRN
jgi:phosphatidylinositol alpha-1,6-mannosyltransferase